MTWGDDDDWWFVGPNRMPSLEWVREQRERAERKYLRTLLVLKWVSAAGIVACGLMVALLAWTGRTTLMVVDVFGLFCNVWCYRFDKQRLREFHQ